MRQLFISIVTLLLFSMALTACSSSSKTSAKKRKAATPVVMDETPEPPVIKIRDIATSIETPADFTTLTSFDDEDRKGGGEGTTDNALKIGGLVRLTSIEGKTKNDRITGGVVQFDYDADGDFTSNGLTLYFADKKDTDVSVALKRDGFGFATASAYMASIRWSDNGVYYGIAGFETANITETGNAIFKGQGIGTYSDGATSIATNFDIIADVRFGEDSVTLSSSNTCTDSSTCKNTQRSHLNFSGKLSYKALENILASTANGIATKGDADNASLTGIADARFYGPTSEELGGTFRLSNSKDDYIGWFGSEFDYDYDASEALKVDDPTEHAELNGKVIPSNPLLHADFAAAVDAGTASTFTMKAFGFSANKTTDYTRPSLSDSWVVDTAGDTNITRSDDAVVDVSFDEGKISGVTIYIGDKKYKSGETMGSPTAIGYLAGITGTNYTTTQLLLDRVAVFGSFESKYMAYLRWIVERDTAEFDENKTEDSSYKIRGRALAGLETTLTAIPTENAVDFTGKGFGNYYTSGFSSVSGINFNITANIDFAARTAKFASTGSTQGHLDFTTPYIQYAADKNHIIGDVTTTGGTGNNQGAMSGKLEARFYGPEAEELGGVFAVQDGERFYQGYFGVERP